MKKWLFFTMLAVGLNSTSMAETSAEWCVRDPDQLPARWQPSPELKKSLSSAPWSEAEAKAAEHAEKTGIEEMLGLFNNNPTAVRRVYDDSVAALLQSTYSSANAPEFDAKVRDTARNNLTILLTPFLDRKAETAKCDEFEDLLPLTIFAHRLYPEGHELRNAVTERVNAAYRACGSFKKATENIFEKARLDNQLPDEYIDHLEDLFDLYAWTLLFIEAELYPEIKLPDEARSFGQRAWDYFKTVPLPNASDFEKGIKDEGFITLADLATHLSHIPSGLGRHPIYVADMPELYGFVRENFYPMLGSGDRDLFSLFVDTLRQYGCTPDNDAQVRDGTRYLLKSFHEHNDKWMNYKEERKTFTDPIEYIRVHHAWTAVLGIRDRDLRQPEPGSYGSLVRQWLPYRD